jgi:hypothetical protein
MGTRARIAVKHPTNGTYASIYTHWDGYPSHHGPRLLKGYTTSEKVCELMALGDLSTLGEEVGVKHDFDTSLQLRQDELGDICVAYGRDRGEDGIEAVISDSLDALKELTQECGGEYLYLFDNGVWYCAEGGIGFFGMPASEAPGEMRKLADVVAEEQQEA